MSNSSSSLFLKSAISNRLLDLVKEGDNDVVSSLYQEFGEAVDKVTKVNSETDIDKLSKILLVLKANSENNNEIKTCAYILEKIIEGIVRRYNE